MNRISRLKRHSYNSGLYLTVSISNIVSFSKSSDLIKITVLTCGYFALIASTRAFQMFNTSDPSTLGSESTPTEEPYEYTGEFLPLINRTFSVLQGFVFLTVFAPHAQLFNTISSNPTLEGFHSVPTALAKMRSHSSPSNDVVGLVYTR